MKQIMKAVRWFFAILLLVLLFALSLVTPIATSTSTLITNRQNPIRWIDNSGIYEQTDQITTVLLEITVGSDQEEISKSDVRRILHEVLTPGFSRNLTEGLINSAYDFFEGKTNQIQVTLDEKMVQDSIIKILANFSDRPIDSLQDLQKLPTCTPQQALELEQSASLEDFELTCIPESIDLDKITSEVFENFGVQERKEGSSLVNLVPTQININNAHIAGLRLTYSIIKWAYLFLALSIIVTSAITIFLIPEIRKGITITSIVVISASSFSLALSILLLLSGSLADFVLSLIKIPYLTDLSVIQILVKDVTGDVARRAIWISLGLIVLFVVLMVAGRRKITPKKSK